MVILFEIDLVVSSTSDYVPMIAETALLVKG